MMNPLLFVAFPIPKSVVYDQKTKVIFDPETKRIYPAGLVASSATMESAKINKAHELQLTQEEVEQELRRASIMMSLLANAKYRTTLDKDGAFGKLTAAFECVDVYTFTSKQGLSASQALNSIFDSKEDMLIDCMNACIIVYYKALLALVGEEKFNAIFEKGIIIDAKFSDHHKLRNYITMHHRGFSPLVPREAMELLKNLRIGQRVYFKNIEPYLSKHRRGEAQGFNVFFLGINPNSKLPIFGGMFEKKSIHNYDDIMQVLAHNYNKKPIEQELVAQFSSLLIEAKPAEHEEEVANKKKSNNSI